MNRVVTVELSNEDLKKIREVASMLRFLDGCRPNEDRCWSLRDMLDIADKKYNPNNEYFNVIYKE